MTKFFTRKLVAAEWKKSLSTFTIVVHSVMHFLLLRTVEVIPLFLLFIDITDLMPFQQIT